MESLYWYPEDAAVTLHPSERVIKYMELVYSSTPMHGLSWTEFDSFVNILPEDIDQEAINRQRRINAALLAQPK